MNIFVTSVNPFLAAKALDDIRVNKMIVENCQMMSTACRQICAQKGLKPNPTLMKAAYHNHGCTVWVRHNNSNFNWLIDHTEGLLEVFDLFGNPDKHNRARRLISIFNHYSRYFPQEPITPFYNGTPDKTSRRTIVNKYRTYMQQKWAKETPNWTNRQPPDWR